MRPGAGCKGNNGSKLGIQTPVTKARDCIPTSFFEGVSFGIIWNSQGWLGYENLSFSFSTENMKIYPITTECEWCWSIWVVFRTWNRKPGSRYTSPINDNNNKHRTMTYSEHSAVWLNAFREPAGRLSRFTLLRIDLLTGNKMLHCGSGMGYIHYNLLPSLRL